MNLESRVGVLFEKEWDFFFLSVNLILDRFVDE